jgi:hypothetical protein
VAPGPEEYHRRIGGDMAFPVGLELVTVTGRIADWPDGAATGEIEFTSKGWLIGLSDSTILAPFVASAVLDGTGSFSIDMPPGNDPDWTPVGWAYGVKITADGYTFRGSVMIPYDQGDVDISRYLTTSAPISGESYVRIADIGQAGGVASLGPDGLVPDQQLPLVGWVDITGKPATFAPADVVDSTWQVRKSDGSAAVRLRSNGGAVDIEKSSGDVHVGSWDGATPFTGTQVDIQRWRGNGTTMVGLTEFGSGPFASEQVIDSRTGQMFAKLGGKNGLLPIGICGRKTTAGAPTTGTWATGDVVLDSANTLHQCTIGGTPGTWS